MAVISVLIANVTFLGWATPPGGSNPYWQGCTYHIFTGFLVVNGAAFMFSCVTIALALLFTLALALQKLEDHQLGRVITGFAGISLVMGILSFITAFLLAGLVAVNFDSPDPFCAALSCSEGGIKCKVGQVAFRVFDNSTTIKYQAVIALDPQVAALNNIPGSVNSTISCVVYKIPDEPQINVEARNATTSDIMMLQQGDTTSNSTALELQTVCSVVEVSSDLTIDLFQEEVVNGNVTVDGFQSDYNLIMSGDSLTLADYANLESPGHVLYANLTYKCIGLDPQQRGFLCNTENNKSVSLSGGLLRLADVADAGGTVISTGKSLGGTWKVLIILTAVLSFFAIVALLLFGGALVKFILASWKINLPISILDK